MKTPVTIRFCALTLFMAMPAYAATRTVLNLGDSGADTLRQCLQIAASGDMIEFNAGLTGTITLATGSLNIASDVSIVGPGPAVMTLSGDAARRIFTATNVSATLSGLTFSNGLADGVNGGALYQAGGTIVFSNCVFLNNRASGANGAAGGWGGAVFTTGGVITARNCAFSNNTAVGPRGLPLVDYYSGGGGGGAGLGGALCLFGGTGYFYQCAFNGNSVTGGMGGRAGYAGLGQNGGQGGGPAGGAGGAPGSVNGGAGGEFSGGGGGKDDSGTAWGHGGAGGFGGGGAGGGAQVAGGSGGTGGNGGQYAGNGGDAMFSGGGAGGGGAGFGGALFAKNTAIICSNVSLTGNSAGGGAGGVGALSGANGTGAGGGLFCSSGKIAMYLATFSGNTADAHRDIYGAPTILGTNGATIGNAESASAAKGTDFGSVSWGATRTNRLAVSNGGGAMLHIGGVTTGGAGAALFQVVGMPEAVAAGASSNFAVLFNPATGGSYACAVSIANDSATTPYIVNLAGTSPQYGQAITNFPNPGTQIITNTLRLHAQASSGLAVTFTNVAGSPVSWQNATTLVFTATGMVGLVALQAGDAIWNAAPAMTNTFAVARASQAIANFTPTNGSVFATTSTVRLAATASSGLPVSFSVASGPGSLASGTNLSFTGAGSVGIVASQGGDATWNPAVALTNVFSVTSGVVFVSNLLSIVVTPSRGTWTLSGPAGYVGPGSGEGSFGPTHVPIGTYTVNYGDLAGFRTPSNETAALAVGGSVEFHGAYVQDAPGGFGTNGATHLVLYERATGRWYARAPDGEVLLWAENWGAPDMIPVPGDFDGDGIGELGVYDPATGRWYIRTLSGTILAWAENWGGAGFMPLIGDYNGDGLPDLMVESYGFGLWYCRTLAGDPRSGSGASVVAWGENWGGLGLLAIPGDYNGDATWDMAVYGMGDGNWYIRTVAGGLLAWAVQFGGPGLWPVYGDYDGDGVFDLAVYGDGVWYIATLTGDVLAWGMPFGGDTLDPVPGDYDGDGRWDLALYSEILGKWYIFSLTQGVLAWDVPFGGPGLTPVYW